MAFVLRVSLIGFLVTGLASAITIGQVDTFQNGTTDGWFAGGLGFGVFPPIPPAVVPNGGPMGVGDQYLKITAIGGNGAGSRIAAINVAQWAGNYAASGIGQIAMDLANFGPTEVTIRILLEDPMMAPPEDEAVTTFGAMLPVGGLWQHFIFPVNASGLTALSGDINTLLSNVTLMRIINSAGPTDAEPIVGVVGVDNIAAIPEPDTWMAMLGGVALLWRRTRRRG
jgi:hypothetical protein